MNTLDKKRTQRFQYLKRLYELSGGDKLAYYPFAEVGRDLGWDDVAISDEVSDYLKDEGLIDFPSFGTVSITHAGIKVVEMAFSNPNQSTNYFQAMGNIQQKSKPIILLVTVTKVESRAVMRVFEEATSKKPQPKSVGDRIYQDLGNVNGWQIYMAISEMGTSGLGASLQTVEKGIDALSPTAVILVGIAFGVNEQEQTIGDILIAVQLWLYDLMRVGANRIVPRGDKPHASSRLINYFRSANLYWDDTKAKVRFGLILSGEKLIDDVDYRDQLKQFEPEAIGGEMEGGGLYAAAVDRNVDWILVKAICDWADGNKAQDKEKRQQVAAHNAACYVLNMLQKCSWQDTRKTTTDTNTFYGRLNELVEVIDKIKQLDYYHPDFQKWHNAVKITLREIFDEGSYYVREYDKIAWHTSDRLEDKEQQILLFERSCVAAEGLLTAIVITN